MRVIIVEPKKAPVVTDIADDLKTMQKIVGGRIQVIYPFTDEVALVCNDEAKLEQLPPNRGLFDQNGELYDIICGTFFLCGAPSDSDNLAALTNEQAAKFTLRFQKPEWFIGVNGHILCMPMDE